MLNFIWSVFVLGFFLFFLTILICIIVAFINANESAKNISLILSHWSHMIEGLEGSTEQFYSSLEIAMKNKQVPETAISRVAHREGGAFSSQRLYLRVQRKDHVFDVCAAPFGNGFFISWWLGESLGVLWTLILKIPFLGNFLFQIFRPITYYSLDTASMFQSLVSSAVMECVDGLTNAKGMRLLTERERRPIMSELFTSSSFKNR